MFHHFLNILSGISTIAVVAMLAQWIADVDLFGPHTGKVITAGMFSYLLLALMTFNVIGMVIGAAILIHYRRRQVDALVAGIKNCLSKK